MSSWVGGASPLSNNTFHHLVGVRDVAAGETTLRLYVDGQLVATAPDASTSGLSSGAIDYIGRRFACPDHATFFGLIDEVRTYDQALSGVEVQARFGGADVVVTVGQPVDFSALATDPAGVADPLTYEWNFGDGSHIDRR